ncbi:DUF2284 domain-containing protein [Prevotella aurantiaca JCM 15754]|jgi:hypothetical protein|uniref:DUF2284 domain-containing protein n=1 Tax=Prevotella aurantiaca TaxID=596085 RepID=UPI000468FB1C|nr:DUF2284 domain-containing protein [Prevotella aurantiaca]
MEIRSLTSVGNAVGKGFELTHVTTMIPVSDYAAGYRDVEKFLGLCKQCPKFGLSWTCPPCEFDVKEFVDKFKYAHILGSKMTFDEATLAETNTPEALDVVCRKAMRYGLVKASAYLRGYERKSPGSICFLGSQCLLCGDKPCSRIDGEPCRHPKEVRVSLEAVGFDLSKTTQELLDIELKWGKHGRLPQYITLVTALFTNDATLRLE